MPKEHAGRFPDAGTHLARFAGRLPAVEINSSFYRPHRPTTYARWAASVPPDFRFAVKVPKAATHDRRSVDANDVLDDFLAEATQLGDRFGPLLVQLPPSLSFNEAVADKFFAGLRERFDGDIALEPRHASWFDAAAERLMTRCRVARVAADPAVIPEALTPGGWDGLVYYRLHGSPKMYNSAYPDDYLKVLSKKLAAAAKSASVWCVFDNTAAGAATVDALSVLARLRAS